MPMIGSRVTARMAAISSAPLARSPAAPPCSAACAMAAMWTGPCSGLSARAWHETTRAPRGIGKGATGTRAAVTPRPGGSAPDARTEFAPSGGHAGGQMARSLHGALRHAGNELAREHDVDERDRERREGEAGEEHAPFGVVLAHEHRESLGQGLQGIAL